MKKTLIRLLSLLLLAAVMLPCVVACKDDPPENEGGGEGGGSQTGDLKLGVKQTGSEELVIFDPQSANLLSKNLSYDASLGKHAVKWNVSTGTTTITTIAPVNEPNKYYYVEFSVYSQAPTDVVANLTLMGCRTAQPIVFDFAGWKDYKIRIEEFSVVNPYPSITGFQLTYSKGQTGTPVYISEIKLTKPVYEIVNEGNLDLDDSALYQGIIKRYRNYLVGDTSISEAEEYKSKIGSITGGAGVSWQLFKDTYTENAAAGVVFGIAMEGYDPSTGKVEPKLGTNLKSYYEHLKKMAQGYASPTCQHYKNKDLLADILKGLEYGYEYYYGKEILHTGKTYGDWFPWDISIPGEIVSTLACIEPDIDTALIDKYLEPFTVLISHPMGAASNKLTMGKNVIVSAALRCDAHMLAEAIELCSTEYVYVDEIPENAPREARDGGFYSDGSFVQHNGIAYTYSYGIGLLGNVVQLSYILSDTPFEPQGEHYENQYEWVFNAFMPMTYDINAMSCAMGRNFDLHSMERNSYMSLFGAVAGMRVCAPDHLKAKFDSLLKMMLDQLDSKNHMNWKGNIPLFAIESTVALMSDNSVTYEPYLATKVMRNMDRVVHHGTKYGVALAMSSTRMYKYEAINGNGELGWYNSDGMLYIYTDGYDYGFHHFDYANPYLKTGTTVNLAQRNEVCIYPAFNNTNPFAGGASQGLYGAAGFILSNPENAPTFADSKAKKISAKKSYFFFDNEIVCLGSDINDVSGKRVVTTVDNRLWSLRWTKDGYLFDMGELVIDGQKVESATVIRKEEHNTAIPTLNTMTKLNSRAMWFKNMGGYVFLDNSDVYYQVAANPINKIITSGTGTREYLEIVIDHGVGDGSLENNAYAYLYLPELSAAETESYAQSPDVAIIRRNNKTHAVIEKTLGIFSCIVFDADSFNVNNDATNIKSVDAQTPLALMVSKDGSGQTCISVSDPTQTYRQIIIDLEIEGITQVVSTDENVEARISGGVLSITVKNAKETPGASFNLTVK